MKSSSTDSSDGPVTGHHEAKIYLWILAAGLALGLVTAEILLRTFVLDVVDGRAHRVRVVYEAHESDVVLGDSHLYLPFVNSERFVNLARPGSSPHALEIVAREYFRHRAPGRVIVEASPQLFRSLMQQRKDQHHDRYFTHNFGQPFVLAVFEPGISRELAALWNFAALRKSADVARGRRRLDGPIVERQAQRRRSQTREMRVAAARGRIQSNRPVAEVRTSPSFLAYRRMLEDLKEAGATVCLARTPVTELYLTLSAQDPVYVDAETALRELATELDLPFVDFLDLDLPFDVASYRNPDHLTTRAGELYATRLERACFGEANELESTARALEEAQAP